MGGDIFIQKRYCKGLDKARLLKQMTCRLAWKVGFVGFVYQSSHRQGVGFPPSYLPARLRATCLKPKPPEKNVNGSP